MIKELTLGHEKKYAEIKHYYLEITNTNMEIIKQLKEDLADAKATEATKNKDFKEQQAESQKITVPLNEAQRETEQLLKKQIKYEEIKEKLEVCKKHITEDDKLLKELEWEYEVKL